MKKKVFRERYLTKVGEKEYGYVVPDKEEKKPIKRGKKKSDKSSK